MPTIRCRLERMIKNAPNHAAVHVSGGSSSIKSPC